MRKLILFLITALLLAACGASNGTAANGNDGKLKVGASPVPHAEILQYIKDNLAQSEGLDLEIVPFTDYVQPNVALNDGQIDANFFQHVPYMQEFGQQRGIDMVAVAQVHIEPLGIYSRQIQALSDLPEGATVAIPNDPTNGGRALQLLAANGVIGLREGAGVAATKADVTENPKQVEIEELEAAQLPRALDDATIAVINMNYALEADLNPGSDALALEAGQDNPYANVLAVIKGHENDPDVQKLAKLLNSPEVRQFIEEKYQGAIVPAF